MIKAQSTSVDIVILILFYSKDCCLSRHLPQIRIVLLSFSRCIVAVYRHKKKKTPTPSTQVPDAGAYYLRDKNTVSENFVVANCPLTLTTAITGVALYCINDTILHSFNDSGMIRKPRYTRCRRDDIHTLIPVRPLCFQAQAVR